MVICACPLSVVTRLVLDMADSDISAWFRSIPIVTRCWFALSIIFPLAGRLGLADPMFLILDYESIVHGFQVICFRYFAEMMLKGLALF